MMNKSRYVTSDRAGPEYDAGVKRTRARERRRVDIAELGSKKIRLTPVFFAQLLPV
jgi:hypothetical protein